MIEVLKFRHSNFVILTLGIKVVILVRSQKSK